MEKSQVLLIRLQPLLGEGLQRIFQAVEEIDLVCLDTTDLQTIDLCLRDLQPAMVLLAGEKEDDLSTHLISHLLKQNEDIPVVWVELETTRLRLYISHSLTANSAELIHAIRARNAWSFDVEISEKPGQVLPASVKAYGKRPKQKSHR